MIFRCKTTNDPSVFSLFHVCYPNVLLRVFKISYVEKIWCRLYHGLYHNGSSVVTPSYVHGPIVKVVVHLLLHQLLGKNASRHESNIFLRELHGKYVKCAAEFDRIVMSRYHLGNEPLKLHEGLFL